ncbi:hypothetical protein [Neorhizobium sp. JUb45]|uniref:hypothetical protein n=1 Tax=unclassified Neorhizobium TaxID=2629175 RepID=UPI0010498CD0|nr:hypothetical protein [Neorhizobium sp. JUb45]TCQ96751.1 hypothetical protein EDF70_11543 [Neorhizobium sp. JUb45]
MANPEDDAKGRYAPSQADPHASGVHSAKPTVITGSEDVTERKVPLGQKGPNKDWDINFDPAESSSEKTLG